MTFKRAVSCFLLLFFVGSLWADDRPLKTEIKHKNRDLNKVKEELKQKQEEKERLGREAEDLSSKILKDEQKAKDIEKTLTYTRQKNITTEREVAQTKNNQDRLLNIIEEAKGKRQRSFQVYYVASALYGGRAPTTAATRQSFHWQSDELRRLLGKKDDVGAQLEELVQTQRILRGELDRQVSTLRDIQNQLDDQGRLLTKKMTRREILEKELQELEQTAQELASLIDVLRTKVKEQEDVEKQARLEKQKSGPSPVLPHSLPWPVKGKVVTPFGRQTHPTLGTPFISNGVLIRLPETQPVLAVEAGRVLYVGPFMSYGSMALVEHEGDWYTVYGRLARWEVEKGQLLKKEQVVGWAGAREGGGAETYFELRFYGKPTDPLPWLFQR